jgi:hypothetical protein
MKMPALVDLTCREITDWVTDYMTEGVMQPEERAQFELHLHACTWCMTYFRQLDDTARKLPSLILRAREPARFDVRDVAQHADAEQGRSEVELLHRFRSWAGGSAAKNGSAQPAIETRALDRASEGDAQPGAAARSSFGPRAEPRASTGTYFKFLERGARGSISRFAWPLPTEQAAGAWVEVSGPLALCTRGIHACRSHELARWLDDELWLIELGAERLEGVHAVLAARARLLRKVDAWDPACAARFAEAAYEHAADAAGGDLVREAQIAPYLATKAYHLPRGNTALAAFCSAMTVARLYGGDHFAQAGYEAERLWQSAWLARELKLA